MEGLVTPERGLNGKGCLHVSESADSTANAGSTVENDGEGFKAPQTQEELDRIIQKRLDRERSKFSDYNDLKATADQLQTKYDDASKQLNESLEKLSGYEAKEQRAAMVSEVSEATGLPAEAVESLGGTTVEDLTAQAERLKPFIGSNRVVIPNAGDAPDKKTSPESDFVGNLFGQGT